MRAAVESYLGVRRAAGFTLSNTEYLLHSFADFAADRKQTHIRTPTVVEWASQARSVAQRHTRYQTVYRFAQYLSLEDSRHQSHRRTTLVTERHAESRTFTRATRFVALFSPLRGFLRPTRCCLRRMQRCLAF